LDVLPQDPSEEILKMLGSKSIAERFSVEQINKKINLAFDANGLKHPNFQFAILSTDNNSDVELASPGFVTQYDLGLKDTSSHWIHIWPLVSLTDVDAANLLPKEKLIIVITDIDTFVLRSVEWMILAALFFSLVIIAAFYFTIRTILTQKKLSEMKTDFINNMTHELRTPLATISIAVDTLKNERVIGDKDKLESIRGIIKAENSRMNAQVEQILQAAQLDVSQVLKDKVTLHVHEVLQKISDNFSLQLQEKNGHLEFKFNATSDAVAGHPVHFVNMLSNLVDNALKYSKEDIEPIIVITTANYRNTILITVEDNGIGMSKETASKVFDKFYRAHTGNIHNVKGFGLGLNYTRKMVDAHKGKIQVDSVLGKGTIFTISLPLE
jgi:two-component system phosphate regulon sensor histidine kinase PhoR